MTPTSGWRKVVAGHWTKEASISGSYHAERFQTPWGQRWVLRYEGAHSGQVGYFDTLRTVKEYVDGIGDGSG